MDRSFQSASAPSHFFANRVAVLATMHRKEEVIAPLLWQALGLQVVLPPNFDTDRFGTFSRDVKRAGTQLETARLKAEQAMQLTGHPIGLASEGAFGPHPAMPYLPCNRELVMLIDRAHQIEVVGEALSTETNFNQTQVKTWEEAQRFAERVGFPNHGLVVIAGTAGETTGRPLQRQTAIAVDADRIIKGITTEARLKSALEWALGEAETAWLETDMRALYNPMRMRVIQQATQNLIQKAMQCCPECGCPGFAVVERQSGLPCGLCGLPTAMIRADVYSCQRCGFRQVMEFPDQIKTADPTYCGYCNP
jgi:hypothetical protein